jgi:hypothetical protein
MFNLVNPNPKSESEVRPPSRSREKIPKKSKIARLSRHSHRGRDLDVFPGFVSTKDTRVSIGNKAYREHFIYPSQWASVLNGKYLGLQIHRGVA